MDIYEYNGGHIIDERVYQKGLSNRAIADLLLNFDHPNTLVIADSAEPKSIDEIRDYGVAIIGAKKGRGSVLQGIQYVQSQQISLTKRSVKTNKAYKQYMWAIDRQENIIQIPDDGNHEWSNPMDALRYGFNGAAEKAETNMDEYEAAVATHMSLDRPDPRRPAGIPAQDMQAYERELRSSVGL